MSNQPQDEDFSYRELGLIYEASMRENQLRNFRHVLNQPMPKKKEKRLESRLAGYVQRNFNAQNVLNNLMKKKGYHKK